MDWYNLNRYGLTIGHEGTIPKTYEYSRQKNRPSIRCDGQEVDTKGQADEAWVHDPVFTFAVEDDPQKRAGNSNNNSIDYEEVLTSICQVDIPCIGSHKTDNAGVSQAHKNGSKGDGIHPCFNVFLNTCISLIGL